MLLCKDNSIYTGITTDIERRFLEHKNGLGARFTRARGVVKIIYSETHENRSLASKRESEIKSYSRSKKIALSKSKSN